MTNTFAISISLQKDCIEETNNVPQQWKRSIHTSKDREVDQHQEKNNNRWRQNWGRKRRRGGKLRGEGQEQEKGEKGEEEEGKRRRIQKEKRWVSKDGCSCWGYYWRDIQVVQRLLQLTCVEQNVQEHDINWDANKPWLNQAQQVSGHCTKHEGIHKPEPGGSKKIDRAIGI